MNPSVPLLLLCGILLSGLACHSPGLTNSRARRIQLEELVLRDLISRQLRQRRSDANLTFFVQATKAVQDLLIGHFREAPATFYRANRCKLQAGVVVDRRTGKPGVKVGVVHVAIRDRDAEVWAYVSEGRQAVSQYAYLLRHEDGHWRILKSSLQYIT